MKYKVGDKVRIKSLDWYNENKDELGNVGYFSSRMKQFCGQIAIINKVVPPFYHMENVDIFLWTDEMIEGLVEEEITNVKEENKMLIGWIKEPNRYRLVTDKDYEIKQDGDNFYLVKKKKEYPKTCEECYCVLLERASVRNMFGYKADLMVALQKLLVCRDAYWKIYGDEMGLGKPWEPEGENTFGIFYDRLIGEIEKQNGYHGANATLEFPTEEMRDAFYENFKELINECKELL